MPPPCLDVLSPRQQVHLDVVRALTEMVNGVILGTMEARVTGRESLGGLLGLVAAAVLARTVELWW